MAELEAVARNLAELDEDELTVQLGELSQYVDANPDAASIDSIDAIPRSKGAFDDLLNAGKNVFTPASAQAYKILCSPIGGNNSELAAELDKLMNDKTTEAAAKMTAALTPVLVSSLGLPQSIAVMVGSLIVKKVAKGASDFICENWKVTLEGSASASDSNPEGSPIALSEPPDMPESAAN
jgi:hypothetical protein